MLIEIKSKICFPFNRILSWKNILSFSPPAFLAVRKSSWNFTDASKPDSSERSVVKSVSHGAEFHFCKHSFAFWAASSSFFILDSSFLYYFNLAISLNFTLTLVILFTISSFCMIPIHPPFIFDPWFIVISIHWP